MFVSLTEVALCARCPPPLQTLSLSPSLLGNKSQGVTGCMLGNRKELQPSGETGVNQTEPRAGAEIKKQSERETEDGGKPLNRKDSALGMLMKQGFFFFFLNPFLQ